MKRGLVVPPSRIGSALRDARRDLGLSLASVEEFSGGVISKVGVLRIERGERSPTLRTLEALASVYDVRIVVGPDGTVVESTS